MAIEVTPLGFKKPDGNELVRGGDNVIAANGAKAEELHQDARGRLTAIESKNATQDGRLTGVESKNATQDARLANLDNAAGFTGDPLALNDAAFAETLTNGTATQGALEGRLEIQVPPIVAAAIASDPTVAESAATMAQNTAGLVPVFKASTAYTAGQRVIAPNGDIVSAKIAFTSGATYSATNWNPSTQSGGTALGTTDLTTITTPGQYYQTSNGNATLARGYPAAIAGQLVALPWGTNLIRVYWPYVPGIFYVQTVNGGVFGAWKAFPSADGVRTFNTDLDTVMTPGPWFQQDKTSATTANHYPAESLEQGAGVNLSWADNGAVNRVQFFYPGSFQRFHRRTVFNGVPRAWETYEPTDVIQAKIMSQVTATVSVALPTDDWAHWGDSLTDDAVLGADSWVAKLAALTGKQHYNGGWYGQKTGEITARIGAVPMLGTFPGGSIPASGSTAYFTPTFGRVAQNNKTTRQIPGTIAGRYGYFTSPFAGDIVFTPTDGVATATTVTGTQKFIPDNPYSNRITTLWAGTNDISLATTPEGLTSMVRASIDYLTPRVKRFLVFTLPQGATRPVGGTLYQKCAAINAAYRTLAPGNVVEMAAYLMTDQAAADAGITFTADDYADIANGYTPRSFRSDDIHFNATAGIAIAKKVYAEAASRGWL